jgi:hypothetical protein
MTSPSARRSEAVTKDDVTVCDVGRTAIFKKERLLKPEGKKMKGYTSWYRDMVHQSSRKVGEKKRRIGGEKNSKAVRSRARRDVVISHSHYRER